MIFYKKEAKSFVADFKAEVQAHHWQEIQAFAKGHTVTSAYCLTLRVYLPTLVNTTWLNTKNKASSPYKRVDAPNRDKLVIDAFSTLVGIDDSLAMRVVMEKYMDPDFQGVEITLEELDPRAYGIPPEYLE